MSPRRITVPALVLAAIGLALLLVGLFAAPNRAWFAYLDAWLFGTSIALGALIFGMIGHVSKASWMVMTRRPMESVAATLPVFALLFVPLAFGLGHIYPWAGHHAVDPALAHAIEHKKAWLNEPFFIVRTGVYFLVFCLVAGLLRGWSRENDERPSLVLVLRMRRLSGGALPVIALVLTWASFDWSMSLQPEWYSTMFGVYFFAGGFVGAIGLACVMMRFVRPQASPPVRLTPDQSQALGRVLFAMVIFWAYISYGQLLIYWIGNIPDEVSFYLKRVRGSWDAITYVIVFGHFVLPFFALLNRHLKRHSGVLALIGGWVFVFHYIDVYWQVLPVVDPAGVRPSWLDLAAALFIGGLSVAWIVRCYQAAPPLPLHSPELVKGLEYEAAV